MAGGGAASPAEPLPGTDAVGTVAAASSPSGAGDTTAPPRPRQGRPQEGDSLGPLVVPARDDDGRARVAPPRGVGGGDPSSGGASTKALRARFVRALLLSTMELEG